MLYQNISQQLFKIFDAYTFINDRIREATTCIILIDNYIDDSVLTILSKRADKVAATIYTKKPSAQLQLDVQKHNAQYPLISVIEFDRSHDRFLCIDETVYHLGASIKDLGKKWFAFNRMEMPTTELLKKNMGVRDHERELLTQESTYVLQDPREIIEMTHSC